MNVSTPQRGIFGRNIVHCCLLFSRAPGAAHRGDASESPVLASHSAVATAEGSVPIEVRFFFPKSSLAAEVIPYCLAMILLWSRSIGSTFSGPRTPSPTLCSRYTQYRSPILTPLALSWLGSVRRPAPSAGDQLEGRRSWDHDRNCLCPLASSTSDHRSDCRSFSSSSPSSSDRGREPYHGEDSSSWYAAEPSNDTRQQQEKQQQHRHCCRTESTSPPWGTDARASSIRRPPCRAHDVGCENTKISRSKDNQLKRRRWYLQQSWSRLGPHSPGCRGRRHSNGNNHEGISRDRGRHEQREAERDCSEDINTTRGTMMPPSEACGSTRAYDDDFACSRTRRGPDTYESCALMVGRKFQPLANCCSTGDTNNSNNSSIKKPFTQWSPQSPPSPPSPTLPSSPLSAGAPLSRASKTSDRRSPLERRFHATESNLQQTPTKQQQQQEGQQQLLKKTSSRFTRSNAFFSERGRGASLTGTGAGDTNGNRGERGEIVVATPIVDTYHNDPLMNGAKKGFVDRFLMSSTKADVVQE